MFSYIVSRKFRNSLRASSLAGGALLVLVTGQACKHNYERGPSEPLDKAVTSPEKGASTPQVTSRPENIVLKLSGSTTIGEPIPGLTNGLAGELAAAYLKRKMGASETTFQSRIEQSGNNRITRSYVTGALGGGRTASIEIVASGSGKAFDDMRNEQSGVDIGMSSRKPTEAEASYVNAEVIALDAVAVIVNKQNPIRALTRTQLRDIYLRRITNWSEIPGGKSGGIVVFSRPFPDPKSPTRTQSGASVSGTYEVFHEKVLKPDFLRRGDPMLTEKESSSDLAEAVAKEPNAIGYVGQAFAGDAVQVLAISDEGLEPVVPNVCSVAQERYILARRLFLLTRASGMGDKARDFIDFVKSDDGQSIVPRAKAVARRVNQFCEKGPVLVQFSTSLHFSRGKSNLDTKARQDLDEIIRRTRPEDRLVVLGHADGIGGTDLENLLLSRRRADEVAGQLRNAGRHVMFAQGLGSRYPVQSDKMEGGPDANRRVEILVTRVPGE